MALRIGPFFVADDPTHPDHLDARKMSRLRSLAEGPGSFYGTQKCLEEVIAPFLDEADADADGRLSLRHVDFFLQHMAGTVVTRDVDKNPVRVRESYRAWLGVWKRTLFDCFRRHQRVYFRLGGGWASTTVGQLNFFFWASTSGTLRHLRTHRAAIDREMKSFNGRRRRGLPSKPPPAPFSCHSYVGARTIDIF